jgi:hypothetical protein
MECGIWQWEQQTIKSITALRFCKSEHPAAGAQHNFSRHPHSPNNQPLHSPSHQTISNVDKHKNWLKGPPSMNGNKSRHQPMSQACHIRHGQILTNCQSDVSKYDLLTKISVVNHKQLSNDIMDPLFLWYLWVSSVKAEPQWPKYPNLSVRSFVTSEKLISLEF